MEKASKALRRSSVRLKSMSSGHRELNMVISELRDMRSNAKAFATAQNTATQDMLKWSLSEENPAIQDTFVQLAELNSLWTEVQKEFADHLKEFITQFEMILEGEQHIDQARTHVTACEMRTAKIKKELKKASKRGNSEEIQQLEAKLAQAEKSCDQAQFEVLDRIQEHEAVKLIRVKGGLLKLSDSYLELAHKCHVIHEAHRDIAHQIPDVHDKELHEIRYTGHALARQAVLRAKDQVRVYNRRAPCAPPPPDGPPPPYSPTNHTDNTTYSPQYLPHSFSPDTQSQSSLGDNLNPFRTHPQNMDSSQSLVETPQNGSARQSADFSSPSRNPFDEEDGASSRLSTDWNASHTEYEEELAAAVAKVKT
ncbi:uncharacterized protein [Periplaneta americana]|uniref:uncharacterized protein isoform X1 n=1 Tax=Periplaneta americana TaxID=6978 RepID=UPI0037E8BB7F